MIITSVVDDCVVFALGTSVGDDGVVFAWMDGVCIVLIVFDLSLWLNCNIAVFYVLRYC